MVGIPSALLGLGRFSDYRLTISKYNASLGADQASPPQETIVSQPVKLIALLKAAPGMSREEFGRRWIDGHGPITLRFKNLKAYRINVAIDEYQEIDGELPYDGTAELWWDSLEEMRKDFDSPEAEAAVADVNEFVTLQTLLVTRETVMLDPVDP
jgi:uncharacterized protein (TIGR02118 family)